MKKLLALLLSLIFIFSFAACSETVTIEDDTSAPSDTADNTASTGSETPDGEPSSKLPESNAFKVALKGIMQNLGL